MIAEDARVGIARRVTPLDLHLLPSSVTRHGVLVRANRQGLRAHRCRPDRRTVYREDEERRRQGQASRPASPHDLLWRAWCAPSLTVTSTLRIANLKLVIGSGDTVQFAEYVERNLRLYQIRNYQALRPHSAASWIRRALADSLRSRSPYSVNLLVGGYDTTERSPHLYWIDYLGTMATVPFAAHGYGSYFALSLLDR